MTPLRTFRRSAATLALAGLAAVPTAVWLAPPATAGTVTSPNACFYTFDGVWRPLDLALSATASTTAPAAGEQVQLSAIDVATQLPAYVPAYGFQTGVLDEGHNELPARIWIAITGTNTEEGTQVFPVDVDTAFTIEVDDAGSVVERPIDVRFQLPASTWTATGGPVTFSQAPAGAIDAPVPAVRGEGSARGSAYLFVQLASLRFILDCQPGEPTADFKDVSPAAAAAFEPVGGQPTTTTSAPGPTPTTAPGGSSTGTGGGSGSTGGSRPGSTGATGTTGAGTTSDLAHTGPGSSTAWQLVGAAVALNLGYLAWSATAPARRARAARNRASAR